MACQRFEEKIDIKVSPKRMWWACIKDGHNCSVKSSPDKIARAANEGESFGEVGTERTVYLHNGVHPFDFVKAKVEEVDEEKLCIKVHVSDGSSEEGTVTNSYYLSLHFVEGAVKCTIESKGSEEIRFVEDVKDFIYNALRKIEAFLVANQNEYQC